MTATSSETLHHPPYQEQAGPRKKRRGFLHRSREEQIQILLDWLPPDLQALPGISWTTLLAV